MAGSRFPTEDELCRAFERELASVTSGGGMHSGTGLDMDTDAALLEIVKLYPAVPQAVIAAARAAFARQLDGTNAAARRAELERRIAEHNRRKRGDRNR